MASPTLRTKLFPEDIKSNPFDSKTEFHVNHLKAQFTDVARPNQYKVLITPPTGLSLPKTNLMVLAKSVKIPSLTVNEYVYQRAGQKLYIPIDVTHGDATITFYNDSNYELRIFFNLWIMSYLKNWEENIGSVPSMALSGEVSIYHFNYKLVPIYEIKLINCWPKNLSEIDLSQDIENTAEEFSVDFNYTYQKIYNSNGNK